jgi:hypothetical protein
VLILGVAAANARAGDRTRVYINIDPAYFGLGVGYRDGGWREPYYGRGYDRRHDHRYERRGYRYYRSPPYGNAWGYRTWGRGWDRDRSYYSDGRRYDDHGDWDDCDDDWRPRYRRY